MNTPCIKSTSLHFSEGVSDKVYQVTIEPKDDGYIVTFAYGRRGSTLSTGTKTPHIVTLQQAHDIHDKLVASKVSKGYKLDSEPATAYQTFGKEGNDSGIRCQLLNPVDEIKLTELLNDSRHCLQEKHDGRRMLVRKQGDEITGINRRGLVIAIPEPIRMAVKKIPFDVLIDGEALGDTLHAFDLLELKGNDLRQRRYIDRFAGLLQVLPSKSKHLRPVGTLIRPEDKLRVFGQLKQAGREGVVFKDTEAPFNSGRPASGGSQLKYKFVESASFIVTAVNSKRSVSLCLFDGGELVGAGNVTIPPNHEIPQMGTVVEVKYLYAFRESGSIYQPVYLGKRDDIHASDCTTDQLKYKVEPAAA
ncbi:WGR domain-containing protein [Luteolibacter yonseiensis]|uniref:WGR domain-containing protein n=1 Tax=Luteolibacter yonseiensis TaxID=1144680 RepID=A0A934R2W8_9BACT|nr:WGR domain-containing protein [Luteolibacter yonseiensis]MBK1817398.1 WGR domain-containing protein [Luteolibacter yonseiensis]